MTMPFRLLRHLRARPRLLSAIAIGVAAYLLLPLLHTVQTEARVLLAWNVFALAYLALVVHLSRRATPEQMARRAQREHEGRLFAMVLVVIAAVAVLVAIGSQLAAVKDMHGLAKTRHVGLAALTVLSSWIFIQTLFALEYAHDFYAGRLHGRGDSLSFPGTQDPDYADFLYFACVIGTSGQTADVSFSGSRLRRIGLVHCILAFFFNTTVLALTINIAAGLF